MRRAVAGALLAAGAIMAAAVPARAYVRYMTSENMPFYWANPCVGVIAYPAGLAGMMPADQVMNAASAAGDAWSAGQNDTALVIQVASTTGPSPGAKYDGQNSLIFDETSWCSANDTSPCDYDPAALAITTVLARGSGAIVDADIEVNAKNFTWADVDLLPSSGHGMDVQDLQNALTHEMGHLIGLDHPCYLAGATTQARATDNLGNPVPECADAPPAVMESTMYPSAVPGDTSKRTLAADDQLAVTQIYPSSLATSIPPMCAKPTPLANRDSGCAVAGDDRGAGAALTFVVAAMMVAARRRGQRAAPA